MEKKQILKTAISFIGSACVSSVVGMIVKSNAVPTSTKEKIAVAAGSFILSGMIANKASDYLEGEFDSLDEMIQKIKDMPVMGTKIVEVKE